MLKINRPDYKYLFGPVPSRRFGLSLGLDLLTPKTCSYNCLFCEVGRTTRLTLERKEYVPAEAVIAEFDDWLKNGGKADFVTVAGAGEPTLHSRFGFVLDEVRKRCSIRTALLTNASLLYLPEVRKDASAADVVKVSLSAWDEPSFEKINRPGKDLAFDDVVWGLGAFRPEFAGELWLEVFIMAGLNDNEKSVRRIAEIARGFHPDVIHLNTVTRPPAEKETAAVSKDRLIEFAGYFTPEAEVIGGFASGIPCEGQSDAHGIVAMLTRRPCTLKDIADASGISANAAAEQIAVLVATGRIEAEQRDGHTYYLSAHSGK